MGTHRYLQWQLWVKLKSHPLLTGRFSGYSTTLLNQQVNEKHGTDGTLEQGSPQVCLHISVDAVLLLPSRQVYDQLQGVADMFMT